MKIPKFIFKAIIGFVKTALFQILFFLIYPSVSYAWVGYENSFTFWEAIYVFGIMFSSCIAIFFMFKIIFQFFVYIVKDKLKIGLWYVIVPILVLPYIYVVAKIVGSIVFFVCLVFIMTPFMVFITVFSKYLKRKLKIIFFVSKQKKVNPKIIIRVLDLFLFFVSSVISGSILFVLLFTWTSFSNYMGF